MRRYTLVQQPVIRRNFEEESINILTVSTIYQGIDGHLCNNVLYYEMLQ